MFVRVARNEDEYRWDAFVERHPYASPYHLFAWKTAVEGAYGHIGRYLIAEAGQEMLGILPLVHMKILGRFSRLVSLPFCDRAGILADSPETGQELIRAVFSLAAVHQAGTIELRSLGEDISWVACCPYPVVTRSIKVDMTLDLPRSSSELWVGFRSKLRSQIRTALRKDLEFRWTGTDGFGAFYHVYSRNMRRLGSPAHSKKWLLAVMRNYGSRARLGLVYRSGTPIAAGFILVVGRRAFIPWASTLIEYNHLAPGMLLYWRFLEYAADQGFQQFDFGRSTPDEGSYKFKAQWGARPIPLYWHKILLTGKHRSSDSMEPNGRRLAERIWRKMPLTAANRIGPLIRKHISL